MSSKLSIRRATVRKPKICVAAAAAAPVSCPTPPCECFFQPDRKESWTEEQHLFDMYVCCEGLGDVYGIALLTCDGGWWTAPEHQVMNCSLLEELEWNSGETPGTFQLKCTTTFPDGRFCIATADILVKEQEP